MRGLVLLDATEPSATDEEAGHEDRQRGDDAEKGRRRTKGRGDGRHLIGVCGCGCCGLLDAGEPSATDKEAGHEDGQRGDDAKQGGGIGESIGDFRHGMFLSVSNIRIPSGAVCTC